jgi:hypothetical protein
MRYALEKESKFCRFACSNPYRGFADIPLRNSAMLVAPCAVWLGLLSSLGHAQTDTSRTIQKENPLRKRLSAFAAGSQRRGGPTRRPSQTSCRACRSRRCRNSHTTGRQSTIGANARRIAALIVASSPHPKLVVTTTVLNYDS